MYSNMKNVQILVSLLREYGICDIVMSPGGSDIPIIHSAESDDYFKCYSVVDERSAAYYAMGLAQEKRRPVACICTSGTAVCNYLAGITEAYYQDVPVLAITADKNPYFQDQLETQKINQEHVFDGVVKKSVNLPIVRSEEDEWLCNRLINEALLELNHHGTGPVQINIPIVGETNIFDCSSLPKERKISRIDLYSSEEVWKSQAEKLSQAKRIMVVVGQNLNVNQELIDAMEAFYKVYNCMYAVEWLSNVNINGAVNTYPITEMGGASTLKSLKPDIVISLGNNLAAYKLKPFLRNHYKEMENWLVNESGKVRDAYKSLSVIYECTPIDFLKKLVEYGTASNDGYYYELWKKQAEKIEIPELEYWNFLVGKKLSQVIPEDSILHLSILNSTRIMQFFNLNHNVTVYSNVGALGIDGCFSTFAGQAAASDKLAFLLIGDLSFFYDMNAAGLRSIGKNVRIILINNTGGSEFHFFVGKEAIPTIDDYICAKHSNKAEGWIKSLGYDYYAVKNADELDDAIKCFVEPSDKPKFIEVFTDMEDDANNTRKLYADNSVILDTDGKALGMVKNLVKGVMTPKQIQKVKGLLKL